MYVLKSDQLTMFDIDDTLVKWSPTQKELDTLGVWFTFYDVNDNRCETKIVPHLVHIEQLKKHKMRGHTIILWSAGGWQWSKAVAEALQIEHLVDAVMSKPTWIYDDKKPEEFMPKPYWFKDE